jgi:signal transduction histidine kinase
LARDAEITALNHDLEAKIAVRTAELNVALAEEKELNRLKGNFISMVTHEIRTPLALILGSSEILSRYLDRLAPEKRTEHLQTIDAAVQRMSELLEDVLLFSKAEAGRMEFNPVELNLKSFCTQLVDELLSATNRRCPIELTADISEPGRGDEGLLRHVFSNLISNAVKYSPPGTPVKFCVSRDGGNAVFIVQDRGLGIPEVDRKRLFTPFYRGKNVATIQGTGLGLVIVKHCIERHGGSIGVDSAEGLGTTVSVRLPLYSPAHTEFVKRFSQNPTE